MVSFSGAKGLSHQDDAHAMPNHHIRANQEIRAIHAVSESPAQPAPESTAAFCNGPVQIAAPHWSAHRTASQSCSARDVRVARIPLLALRAWMKRVSHASH
jgi:hypothetical protein